MRIKRILVKREKISIDFIGNNHTVFKSFYWINIHQYFINNKNFLKNYVFDKCSYQNWILIQKINKSSEQTYQGFPCIDTTRYKSMIKSLSRRSFKGLYLFFLIYCLELFVWSCTWYITIKITIFTWTTFCSKVIFDIRNFL